MPVSIPKITSELKKTLTTKGWKYRIYPNDQQKYLIAQNIDAAQATYNFLLNKYNEEYFDNTVDKMKEVGLEDKIIYKENGEMLRGNSLRFKYHCLILEKLCNDNGIEVEYKEVEKENKKTGEKKKVSQADYKKMQKALKEKNISYYPLFPKLENVNTIYDSTDTAREHFTSVGSDSLYGAAQNLNIAFKNFYEADVNGNHAGFPQYKKRSKVRDEYGNVVAGRVNGAFTIRATNHDVGFKFEDEISTGKVNKKYLFLKISRKIGYIKIRMHRPFPEGCYLSTYAKISKTSDDKYYILFTVYIPDENIPLSTGNKATGIDLSISDKYVYIDSDNNHIGYTVNSDEITRLEERKIKLQQKLANKEVKSNNYTKLSLKINKLTAKIDRKYRYERQHIAQELVKANDIIASEDLDVKSLKMKPELVADDVKISAHDLKECLKYHKLDLKNPEFQDKLKYKAKMRKKLQEIDLGEFISCIEQEAKKQGKKYIKVSRWFPSTQTCSCCGARNRSYAGLEATSKRTFICEECGATMNRDLNAALNIKNEGLRILNI